MCVRAIGLLPAHLAAFAGSVSALAVATAESSELLLSTDTRAWGVAHYAAAKGASDCLEWLHASVGGSAALSMVDASGWTVAHVCAAAGHGHCVPALARAGLASLLLSSDADGNTPVDVAVTAGNSCFVAAVVELGIPVAEAALRILVDE
jgi:ankyrin repeat protein